MDIEFLVERLEKYLLEESPRLPLGNRAVNEQELRNQLTELRHAVPADIARARELLHQRDAVLAQAQREADQIIAEAEATVQRLVGEHRVMQEAKQQATAMYQQAQTDAYTLRNDADEYVFNALSQLQGELARLQRVVENGLKQLETDRERRLQEA